MSAFKPSITQAELFHWFDYDPLTGEFRWRRAPERSRIKVGDRAGSINKQHGRKRWVIWLQGRRLYASRAAYIYENGDIPAEALVDHKNGDTTDDRITNLRLASGVQNAWNKLREEGQLKLGVTKSQRGRFKARIQIPDGGKVNLGTWATEEEAHAAYMGAAAILHSEFWIGHRLAA